MPPGWGPLGRRCCPANLFVQFNLTARLQPGCNRDCVKIITAPLLIRRLREVASAASLTQHHRGLILPSSGSPRNCLRENGTRKPKCFGFFLNGASHLLERQETAAVSENVRYRRAFGNRAASVPFLVRPNRRSEGLTCTKTQFLAGRSIFNSKSLIFLKRQNFKIKIS